MTGKMLFTAVAAFFVAAVSAAPTNPTGDKPLKTELQQLQEQRRDLVLKQHKKRMELLRTDPKIKRIHQELLRQTKTLALELDSRRDMRAINEEIRNLDTKIDSLRKKK